MLFSTQCRVWVLAFLSQSLFAGDVTAQTVWSVTASSSQVGNPASNVLDSDTSTFWHTQYTPTVANFPHTITIDIKNATFVNAFTYLPRQDGNSNGNIGQHTIDVSTDNTTWTKVAQGNWLDDSSQKQVIFTPRSARYIRLTAFSEAGGRGTWASAATLSVTTQPTFSAPTASQGQWGLTIDFPVVPVAIGLAPTTGQVVAWSANAAGSFGGTGLTQTATYDPATGNVTKRTVTNTAHDMFCPGISMDFNGRITVTGGDDAAKTSIYDSLASNWLPAANMQLARGYQSSATVSDGRIFTIGGSWSGGQGGKNGEIYNPTANTWTLLPGAPVAPMLTNDSNGVYRQDNHAWLFAWKNGNVFQAGPSKAMNWYSTSGSGNQTSGGTRAADTDAMCGTATMYDAVAGKIVSMGGSPNYENNDATTNTHVITIGAPGTAATAVKTQSMSFARAFANAVVLPDGKVFVTGGQTYPVPFSDANSILTPELWDPTTQTFTQMASNAIPRVYHSTAVLLLDGTVFSGGGGLCGTCTTNHFDAQIFLPPYLFNADGSRATRPVISSVSASTIAAGGTLTVKTGSAVTNFSLIRYGTSTHTVNTDQRRIPVTPTGGAGNTYSVKIPADHGVALPGYWMLFAVNSAGVPSLAMTVKIT